MADEPTPIPRLVVSDYAFAPDDRARVEAALAPARLVLVERHTDLADALRAHPETDVLCTFRPPEETRTLAPGLRWLALPSAGAEGAFRAGLVGAAGGPIVTNASGVHAVPISEFVFGALLMWVRHWPTIFQLQQERTWPNHAGWERLRGGELHGATLAVVGVGAIGRQIARLGHAFGMRVLGTRRSASPGDTDPDLDAIFPASQLDTMLAEADVVVIAVPQTTETRQLMGAQQLAAMRSSAFLVNIARGSIVDEPALIRALQDGTIAGAALDVFATEPLPADSPLWTMPNVILSPHISGSSTGYSRRFTDLFLSNLERYRAGTPLLNAVQLERGY